MKLPSYTMVLLDRLRRNDKTYTELNFYENDFIRTDCFLDLVTAILTNTTVQTVRFHDCANPKWSPKQVKLLFSAIARLPNLRILSMAGTTVTLQAVSAVVEKGLQLKELDIWGSELMGTDEDVTRFAAALTESQLRALYLKRVAFSEVSSLDALVAACQSSLDILMLEELDWKGVISDNVFRLLKSSRLAQLGMSKLQLKESHFTGIAEGLKSSSLRYLTLVDTVISDKAAAALAEALTVNENLKRLCLIRCSLSDNAAAALARMLRVNTTLNVLELSDNGIGDTGAIEISNALLDPSSPVKSFELLGNKNIGEAGIQAILQLAEQSHGLESLKLFGFSRKSSSKEQMEIQKKINSYMKFNARIGATSQNPGKRPKVWYE